MNSVSPGLYVNELSYTQYQQAIGGTICCILGGATKGPVNKPTLCTSQGDLVSKFGPPLLTDMGIQSALQFLAGGYQLIFLRIAHTPATSDRNLAGTTGGTPAAKATGFVQFTGSTNPADGEWLTISDGTTTRKMEFDNNNALAQSGALGVTIGTTAAATMANLITALNNTGVLVAVDASSSAPRTNLTAKVGGTAGNVSITTSSSPSFAFSGMTGGAALIAGTSTNVVNIAAASPGTWGNSIQVQIIAPSVVLNAPGANFDLNVIAPPVAGSTPVVVERFTNLSLDSTTTRFIDTVLVNGVANDTPPSRYIVSDALTTGTPTTGTFILGAGGGTVGTDGVSSIVPADYVGTTNGAIPTGLKAVRNAETSEYTLLAIPGVTDATTIAGLIEHAEFRRDHLVLLDPPFGLIDTDLVSWVNGLQPGGVPNSPAVAISSSYASISWPWIKVYDSYNQKDVWTPPSGAVAGLMSASDSLSGPWLPSAGPNRGVITFAKDVERSPDQASRDLLYTNNINPLVKFPNGVERYGNVTLQRASALTQSEHARRTLIYAQKLCAGSVRYLIFDPNDSVTWRKFTSLCNTALGSIKSARGLQAFAVTCDASTNPPDQRARRVMSGQLVVQPVDIAEQIVMSFSASSTGTAFGDESVQ